VPRRESPGQSPIWNSLKGGRGRKKRGFREKRGSTDWAGGSGFAQKRGEMRGGGLQPQGGFFWGGQKSIKQTRLKKKGDFPEWQKNGDKQADERAVKTLISKKPTRARRNELKLLRRGKSGSAGVMKGGIEPLGVEEVVRLSVKS